MSLAEKMKFLLSIRAADTKCIFLYEGVKKIRKSKFLGPCRNRNLGIVMVEIEF